MHTVLPSPSAQSRVLYRRKRSRSPWLRLSAPSAMSPPRSPHSAKAEWSSLRYGCTSRFKSQSQSSSAAPFPTPPTISYTCQHSGFLPALLGCHSKSGQVWPCGTEPVFSKLSRRCCNLGELPPSYILGGSHSHSPGSKRGHSYLNYPWNQLKVIHMLNDYARG